MTKQAFLNLIAQQEEWASAMLKNCEQMRTWVEKMKPTDVLPTTKDGQKGCVTPSTTKRRASYHSSHFFSTPTFLYKYLAPRFDGNKRLAILYRLLAKEYRETKSYIAPETTPDAFFNLFSGRRGSDVSESS